MDLSSMMQQMQGMGERVRKQQEDLKSRVVEGSSGGGMVTAKMNGGGELISLDIDKSIIDPEDSEMLSDLIVAAVTDARKRVEALKMESIKEMTGGMDLSSLGIDMSSFM